MILPAKPSDVRPKMPVFLMSVSAVAGIKGERFKIVKTLKKLARIASLYPSPKNATLGSRLRLTRELRCHTRQGRAHSAPRRDSYAPAHPPCHPRQHVQRQANDH